MNCLGIEKMKRLFNRLMKKDAVDHRSGLSANHKPPNKNFGTLHENIDDAGNINP
jgi:hypothetical protein